MFIISPPAVALRRKENKSASQQSEPFRVDEPCAGIFPRKRSPTVVTVRLLFDERAVNTFLMCKGAGWGGWGDGGCVGENNDLVNAKVVRKFKKTLLQTANMTKPV